MATPKKWNFPEEEKESITRNVSRDPFSCFCLRTKAIASLLLLGEGGLREIIKEERGEKELVG
jgi:redox-regulated HSP33 family molecular chaperone